MPRNSDLPAKPAIIFDDVSKTFNINHTTSLKETFLAAVRRKELSSSFNAVDHVTFDIPEGQSVAIMGRNGSGKSTTLKLLSGVLRPDTGWVRTRGRIAGLLEVGAGFHPDLTGRENVYLNAAILGMSKEETDAKFESILEFSEIGEFIDTEVKRYSSGMYARLGFSVAVHTEVDVLLVDEVLSVGDAQFRLKCERKMLELREQGKTMFIVSHNTGQVLKLCERGIVLDHGKIIFDGTIDEAVIALNSVSFPDTEFSVPTEIRGLYSRGPARFGKPLGEAQEVTENGGGLWQQFEKGIISYSFAAPESERAHSLTHRLFLPLYLSHGGPAGEWGFLAGSAPEGSLEAEGEERYAFQLGEAAINVEQGLRFGPAQL